MYLLVKVIIYQSHVFTNDTHMLFSEVRFLSVKESLIPIQTRQAAEVVHLTVPFLAIGNKIFPGQTNLDPCVWINLQHVIIFDWILILWSKWECKSVSKWEYPRCYPLFHALFSSSYSHDSMFSILGVSHFSLFVTVCCGKGGWWWSVDSFTLPQPCNRKAHSISQQPD